MSSSHTTSDPDRRGAADRLRQAIVGRTARVVIIGQGYVGLPLSIAAAQAGFGTLGFDVDAGIVAALQRGESHVGDVTSESVAAVRGDGRFAATSDPADIRGADVIVLCVPTPLRDGSPDISYIESAAETIAPVLEDDCLVILESTTYPGTTEEVLLPLLRATGGAADGLFVAFSPERIDPGNPVFGLQNTPKVVGGVDEQSGALAAEFYGQFVSEVVRVPGTREAEMSKLIENTFRHVNIALVNELAIFCREAGIDVHAAISAAATKPFGYMAFYPGPGVGGHCIPVDPNYLAWRFRQVGERFRLVEAAEEINSHMPHYVVRRIQSILNADGKPLAGSRVVLVGVAYKPDIRDWRESPAIPVLEQLLNENSRVSFIDPHVPQITTRSGVHQAVTVAEATRDPIDCTVILTAHSDIDYEALLGASQRVYDTRGALSHLGTSVESL